MKVMIALLLLLSWAPDSGAADGDRQLPAGSAEDAAARIDQWVRTEIESAGRLPAMALAVVTTDGPLLVAGYGDVEGEGPVDEDTHFYIASSTKSYLGMLAAKLAAGGVVDLNAGFGTYLPSARLPEALDAKAISVESLLTHSMGFENDPIVYRTAFSGNHDRDTLLGLLPVSEVRDGFHHEYDNVGYVIFSWIVEDLEQRPWQDALRRELLLPAGMNDTTARITELDPHRIAPPMADAPDGGFEPMPQVKTDQTLHAAGGLFTTAGDLGRWLELNLLQGRVGDTRVLAPEVVAAAHRKRVDQDQEFFDYQRTGYALGWNTGEYIGEAFTHHFGSFPGYRAHVSFMPEQGIGVAAVTNTAGTRFFMVDLVANYIYQTLLGRAEVDTRFAAKLREMDQASTDRLQRYTEHRRQIAARTFQLSQPMGRYAGLYTSPELGALRIDVADDTMTVHHGQLSGVAQAYPKPDQIRLELVPERGLVAAFALEDGKVVGLRYLGVDWKRQP